MGNFLKMQKKKENTCRATWNLIVYIITHVSVFLFFRRTIITISCSVLRNFQHDQFLSICKVFDSNPQLLSTWMLWKNVCQCFNRRWILLRFHLNLNFKKGNAVFLPAMFHVSCTSYDFRQLSNLSPQKYWWKYIKRD